MNIKHDYVCYTDGSVRKHKASIGGVVSNPATGFRKEFAHKLTDGSSIGFVELAAIKRALEIIPEPRIETRVVIYTDSQYAQGVLNRDMNAKKNLQLISLIWQLMAEFGEVRIEWQRAHIGHAGNERADKLAKSKSKETRLFVGLDRVAGEKSTFEVTGVYDFLGQVEKHHYSLDEVRV